MAVASHCHESALYIITGLQQTSLCIKLQEWFEELTTFSCLMLCCRLTVQLWGIIPSPGHCSAGLRPGDWSSPQFCCPAISATSRAHFLTGHTQSGLRAYASAWRMIIHYLLYLFMFCPLRDLCLPGKSDLAGLMLSESFACTSVFLFWELSASSCFTSVVSSSEFRPRSAASNTSWWEGIDLVIEYILPAN